MAICKGRWSWASLTLALAAVGAFTACSGTNGMPTEKLGVQTAALTGGGLTSTALGLTTLGASCGANQSQEFLQVQNNSSASVQLSDITIKYWVYDTSGSDVAPHVWYGGCVNVNGSCVHQVSGVTATATQFTPACGSDSTHQANWEITIVNTDTTTLPAGATWGNIQSALNLSNYSNFVPGTSQWYSPCTPGSTYVVDPHYSVYLQGDLVFGSTITAPSCRSPKGQQQLSGYVTDQIANAPLAGPVPSDTVINFSVGLPIRNAAQLTTFIQGVSDPTSATYGQYLTPDQYRAAYSPPATDYQALTGWAQSNGLTVVKTFDDNLLVHLRGTAAAVSKSLFTNLVYRLRPDGSQFFAPDREPSLDLSVPILWISELNEIVPLRPIAGSGTNGSYIGTDFRIAYTSCTTLTGAGQAIGIYAGDGFSPEDLTTYASLGGLQGINWFYFLEDTALGPSGENGSAEIAADIEVAASMAPGATIFVFSGSSATATLENMTYAPSVYSFSTSWLLGLDANRQRILDKMAAQGQSFAIGSGDARSYSFPLNLDSCPFGVEGEPKDLRSANNVTVVGGTDLTTAADHTYVSESGWECGGGGPLPDMPIPNYQKQVDTTVNGGSSTERNLPDISFVASHVAVVFTRKNLTTGELQPAQVAVGRGTSISGPLWAGYVALINEQRANSGKKPLGFANPLLYRVAADPTSYATAFHDIQGGSNFGYGAGAGYDLVTGLGTPRCEGIALLADQNQGLGVDVRVTETTFGPDICGNGHGFTPNGLVSTKYFDIPTGQAITDFPGPLLTADANGNISFFDDSFAEDSFTFPCTSQTAPGNVTFTATDETTGASTSDTFPQVYFCTNVPLAGDFNGGCH